MRLKYFIIFSFVFLLFTGCANNTVSQDEANLIYKAKGLDNMNKSLKPLILKSNKSFHGLYDLSTNNTLATLNDRGEFSTIEIDDSGDVKVVTVSPGFPGRTSERVNTDPEHSFMWLARVRGLWILDMTTKERREVDPSGNTAAEITGACLIDPIKKIFLINLFINAFEIKDCMVVHYLYDFEKDKIINTTEPQDNLASKFGNGNLLVHDKITRESKKYIWYLSDGYFKKRIENKLTDELTKMDLDIWGQTRTINLKKKLLLGTADIADKLCYFSVRWDDKFEEVKVEPIIAQLPDGKMISSAFQFSNDGNWVKTFQMESEGLIDAPRLIIYHVNEMYPQCLSLPIMCGYTRSDNSGAFMMHSVWGPCYVEQDNNFADKLFVYKLNDGLALLAEQAKEMVGK
jgi:hypothetical protein